MKGSTGFGLLSLFLMAFAPLAHAWGGCVCQKPSDITTMPMVTGKTEYKYKLKDGTDIGIPDTFGATCKSWDSEAMSKTFNGDWGCLTYSDGTETGNPNHWCRDTWCYVDACACSDNIPIETMMFTGVSGLFFSYDLCCDGIGTEALCTGTGSMCAWVGGKCSQKGNAIAYLNKKCSDGGVKDGAPDETVCKTFSSCSWADSKCGAASEQVRAAALSCTTVPNPTTCQCKMPKDITTMPMFAGSTTKYKYLTYGVDQSYGGSCKSWDAEAVSAEFNGGSWGCHSFSSGQRSDKPNSFCRDTWCYVDACSCPNNIPIETMMFDGVKNLFFSYDLCCAELPNEKLCTGTGSMCAWDATTTKCSQKGTAAAYLDNRCGTKGTDEATCKTYTSCAWAAAKCAAASQAAREKALSCKTTTKGASEASGTIRVKFVGGMTILLLSLAK